MAKPFLPNIEPLIASGIVKPDAKFLLKENTKKALRIVDETQAVNRFKWDGLPDNFGLTGQEIERLLYYRGQLCFYFDKTLEKYFMMPYAGNIIDYYGRFTTVHPVPISRGSNTSKQEQILKANEMRVIYRETDEVKEGENVCVLLRDYTNQLPQTIIPRQEINDSIIDVMAECVPMMRTSLLASSGVKGIRVGDADQAESVEAANRSTERAAMTGDYLVPIVGSLEFQELTDHATTKAEEYMLALQSLDNLRLSYYGISAGGVFEKKAHELQSEADMNNGPKTLVLQDGLIIRQHFCDVINKVFGVNMTVSINEDIQDVSYDESVVDDDSKEMSSEGEQE